MAPEIYSDHHKHGPSADWFSLGITLHEFVCGRRPFESNRLQSFRFSDDDPLRPVYVERTNYVSESCQDFIVALLNPKSSRRLGTTRGFEEIARHKWLGGVDWELLQWGVLQPPFVPDISKCKNDFKNDSSGVETLKRLQSSQCPIDSEQSRFSEYSYNKCQDTVIYNNLADKAGTFITPNTKSSVGNLSVYIKANSQKIKAMENRGDGKSDGQSSDSSTPKEKQVINMKFHQLSSSSIVLSSSEMDDDTSLSREVQRRVII